MIEAKKKAIEKEYDLPFWDVIQGYIDDGLRLDMLCSCVPISETMLKHIMHVEGVDLTIGGKQITGKYSESLARKPKNKPATEYRKIIEYQGVRDTIKGHAIRHGVAVTTARTRYRRGHPIDKVFSKNHLPLLVRSFQSTVEEKTCLPFKEGIAVLAKEHCYMQDLVKSLGFTTETLRRTLKIHGIKLEMKKSESKPGPKPRDYKEERERVQSRYGMSFTDVVNGMAKRGMNASEIARELGINGGTFSRMVYKDHKIIEIKRHNMPSQAVMHYVKVLHDIGGMSKEKIGKRLNLLPHIVDKCLKRARV